MTTLRLLNTWRDLSLQKLGDVLDHANTPLQTRDGVTQQASDTNRPIVAYPCSRTMLNPWVEP